MDNMTATFLGVAHELLDERPLSCAYKNFNLHSRHDKTKIILINKTKLHASKQNSLVTRQNPLTGNETLFFLFTRVESWAPKIDQLKFCRIKLFSPIFTLKKKTLERDIYFRQKSLSNNFISINASRTDSFETNTSPHHVPRSNECEEIHPWCVKTVEAIFVPPPFTQKLKLKPQKRNGRSRINACINAWARDRLATYLYIYAYICGVEVFFFLGRGEEEFTLWAGAARELAPIVDSCSVWCDTVRR